MKISILMPTYNCPMDLLELSLRSVLCQSHQDFEIIIKDGDVNNPAIDHPAFRYYLENCGRRIQYTVSLDGPPSEESGFYGHNGFYDALNYCVRTSTGDILTLLCSDDERGNSDTLEFVDEQFKVHGPSPLLLYGANQRINRKGFLIKTMTPPAVITREDLSKDYTLYTPSLFWNRAIHNRFGVFASRTHPWCADLDFWLRTWNDIDHQQSSRILGRYRCWDISQNRDENAKYLAADMASILKEHL